MNDRLELICKDKQEVEEKINQLILDFQEKNGVEVTDIFYERVDMRNVSNLNPSQKNLPRAFLEVRI